MANTEQIVGKMMLRRAFDEVEAPTEFGKRRRQEKSAPDITIVWNSCDDDQDARRDAPDAALLFELARALGRFAAYRTLQRSKVRQSSEVVSIETNSEATDVSVGA